MSEIEKLKKEFRIKIDKAQNSKEVDTIRAKIFSKNGFINYEFKKLGTLPPDDRKKAASEINNAKEELLKLFNDKAESLLEVEIDE